MVNPIKFLIIVALILVGIVAFSLCAEGPLDACAEVCCGIADCLRPTGRVARGLIGVLALAASMTFAVLAAVSSRPAQSASGFALRPSVLVAAVPIRI